jgi:hypothetical protein
MNTWRELRVTGAGGDWVMACDANDLGKYS